MDIKPFNMFLVQLHRIPGMNMFGNFLRPFFSCLSKRQEPNHATVSDIRYCVRRKTFQPGSLCLYQSIPETYDEKAVLKWKQDVMEATTLMQR